MSNGSIGILFNDSSKIILSIIGITFFYIDSGDQTTTYTIYEFPDELKKKKSCMDYLIKTIKETAIFKRSQFMKNCELKEPLAYINYYKIAGVCKMFLLNNDIVQFIFDDKSEIHINKNTKKILYFNSKREKSLFDSMNDILASDKNVEAKKRFEYIQNKFKV